MPRIYVSPFPPVPTVKRSIFTHLFASPDPATVGAYPAAFPAFIDAATGTTITRGQLRQHALSFGYGILTHPKLLRQNRGDTLLIYSTNSLAFPVVLFGTVAAGLRCSPANSAYVSTELGHQYTDSGANIVATTRDGLPVVEQMFKAMGFSKEALMKRIIVISDGLGWVGGSSAPSSSCGEYVTLEELLVLGKLEKEEPFDAELSQETCYICYSSGTTGKPKGVEVNLFLLSAQIAIVYQKYRLPTSIQPA